MLANIFLHETFCRKLKCFWQERDRGEGTESEPTEWEGTSRQDRERGVLFRLPLREKQFVTTALFFREAGIGAAPIVTCSSYSTAAVSTNGTVGAAGNTSCPYKCVDL